MQRLPFSASFLLSAVALVLLVVNVSLVVSNRSKQTEMGQRQATIVSMQPVVQLHQALVNMMAEASIKNGDPQITALLSAEGITLNRNADRPAASPAAAE